MKQKQLDKLKKKFNEDKQRAKELQKNPIEVPVYKYALEQPKISKISEESTPIRRGSASYMNVIDQDTEDTQTIKIEDQNYKQRMIESLLK